MSWLGAAVGVTAGTGVLSYLSAENEADAARDAAKYQREGADEAAQVQWKMYNQSRKDMAPWREAGGRGLKDLERVQGTYEGAVMDPSKYVESPGYGWLEEQGRGAINRQSAAQGQFGSGRHGKDLTQYGQGLALQDYQGYLGRLESLMNRYAGTSQVGQTASNQVAGLGANAAANVGNAAMYGGNAMAGGEINQANARTSMYQNFSNIGSNAVNQGLTYNYLQNMGQQPQSQNAQTIRGGQGGGYGF
jgi:hypothetical protein